MDITTALLILISLISLGTVLYLIKKIEDLKKNDTLSTAISQSIELKIREVFPQLTEAANQTLISIAEQKLGANSKEIKTDFEAKRSEIERLVKVIQDDLKESRKGLESAEQNRIGTFRELSTRLDEYKKMTEQLSVTTESLRKVLSNNQLRGQFGEQVADNLLKMAGFVRGVDYEFNKEQTGSETRPDFAIFLPDKTRINVDAKFPYSNLQKMAETDNEEQKREYLKKFEQDVKNKIKQVTTRDYINPEDNTVDFVVLFIPNEMIFSYIYDKMNDIWQDAMSKKVVLTGPFSFTAILRLVKQAYDNFRYQKNIQEIITHIQMFDKEFEKFNTEFVKVGERIQALDKQYHEVSETRVRQLQKRVDKVKLQGGDKEPKELPLEI